MKKLSFVLSGLIVLVLLSSCEKQKTNNFNISADAVSKVKNAIIYENMTSEPVSVNEVTPYLIPGENRGGNRTCMEVAEAFVTEFALCGEKIDYNDGSFASSFPEGLSVTVEGKFITFDMKDCIKIGDDFYMVGAVIVKGSNQANVYWYPDGSMHDEGLAAPVNASGGPAGLSNLTFCFVPCESQTPEIVISVKSFLEGIADDGSNYGKSSGLLLPNEVVQVGYTYYTGTPMTIDLLRGSGLDEDIGDIHLSDFWDAGIHYLSVIVELVGNDGWNLNETHLYAGTFAGFQAYFVPNDSPPPDYILDYSSWPFGANEVSRMHSMTIDYSDILE